MPANNRLLAGLFALVIVATCAVAQDNEVPEVRPDVYRAMNLLQRPSLRKELELVDSQIEDLIELEAERQILYSSPLGKLDQPTLEERQKAHAEFKRLLVELEKKAIGVLLPSQRLRLSQLVWQDVVNAHEPHAGLLHSKMVAQLNMDDAQREVLREKIGALTARYKEREAELLAQIEVAKAAAREEAISTLDAEQRKAYEKLIGKSFDLLQQE